MRIKFVLALLLTPYSGIASTASQPADQQKSICSDNFEISTAYYGFVLKEWAAGNLKHAYTSFYQDMSDYLESQRNEICKGDDVITILELKTAADNYCKEESKRFPVGFFAKRKLQRECLTTAEKWTATF